MSRSKLLPVDLVVSAMVPFLAVWLYEISNWVVLVGQGYSVSFSMDGWLPIGVAGVSTGGFFPLTKEFQIALAIGLLLPLGVLFNRTRLLVAETFVVSTVGVYLASAYWEMLSILVVVPLVVHTAVFIAGTSTLAFFMLRGLSRPRRLRRLPSTISATQVVIP